MNNYFKPVELLKKSPPTRRAYYSDRMAWTMAQLSKLAYEHFEPDADVVQEIILHIKDKSDDKSIMDLLERFHDSKTSSHEDGNKLLSEKFKVAGFDLINSYFLQP